MKTLLLIFILLFTNFLYSTIINIPADQPTIQEGINVAVDSDTVLVYPGTYVENINYNGKNITVASLFLTTQDTTYISQTIIDGDSSGSVVTFEQNENNSAKLLGFSLTEGSGKHFIIEAVPREFYDEYQGGAIYCSNSNPEINFLKIFNNEANIGGGIYCLISNPIIKNLKIFNNHAQTGEWIWANGGGLYCMYSNLVIENIELYNNSAVGSGGGVYCSNSSNISIENLNTYNNIASSGGALYFASSNVQLSNCHIFNNSTSNRGGGITCRNICNLTLTNVSIYSNNAEEKGGGVFCAWDSNLNLINTVISNNTSDIGGGIYFFSGSYYYSCLILENVTLTGNTAQTGGGIYCRNATLDLTNCIMWNDLSQEIFNSPDSYPSTISISYSDIQGGEAGIVTNNNATVNWLEGNIDEDPLFVGTGEHPYSLLVDSPCIDAGNPDPIYYDPEDPTNPGYALYPAMGTIINDMGAYGGPNAIGWPAVDIDDNVIVHTSEVLLHQNYPNPFNPQTTILLSIPEENKVILSIYNIKGQKVKILIDEVLSAGQHSVVWDGRDSNGNRVGSGIYLYRLQTGSEEQVRKMLLLK